MVLVLSCILMTLIMFCSINMIGFVNCLTIFYDILWLSSKSCFMIVIESLIMILVLGIVIVLYFPIVFFLPLPWLDPVDRISNQAVVVMRDDIRFAMHQWIRYLWAWLNSLVVWKPNLPEEDFTIFIHWLNHLKVLVLFQPAKFD